MIQIQDYTPQLSKCCPRATTNTSVSAVQFSKAPLEIIFWNDLQSTCQYVFYDVCTTEIWPCQLRYHNTKEVSLVARDPASTESVTALSPWYEAGSSIADILATNEENAWLTEKLKRHCISASYSGQTCEVCGMSSTSHTSQWCFFINKTITIFWFPCPWLLQ